MDFSSSVPFDHIITISNSLFGSDKSSREVHSNCTKEEDSGGTRVMTKGLKGLRMLKLAKFLTLLKLLRVTRLLKFASQWEEV